jgi:hypothetical protein
MEQRFEDVLQQCIEQLARGASVEELLLAYPEAAPYIEPALRSAETVLAMPGAAAAEAPRSAAMGRMMNELASVPAPAGRLQWLAAFMQRPRAFQAAALAGSIALFGVAGIGAAAATGAGPEPVREFFGLADSRVRIEFDGVVVSVEPSSNTLDVSAGGTIRRVFVDASTELSSGGDAISIDDFASGDLVEVKGSLQADGTILASRVHLEDGGDDDATPSPDPSSGDQTTPGPTADDDGQDDNRGHGNDDDRDDDDNPGNGNDDGDNSGPGIGDDDGEDDNRGHGNDDDGEDEDNPGNGSPDDDNDDSGPENGNSGNDDDGGDDDDNAGDDDDGADDDGDGDGDGDGSGGGDDDGPGGDD